MPSGEERAAAAGSRVESGVAAMAATADETIGGAAPVAMVPSNVLLSPTRVISASAAADVPAAAIRPSRLPSAAKVRWPEGTSAGTIAGTTLMGAVLTWDEAAHELEGSIPLVDIDDWNTWRSMEH